MNDKWVFITAGLGSQEYNLAAERLADDFARFKLDVEIQVVADSNLFDLCPSFSTYARTIDLTHTRGYGYWYWKAELISRAFQSTNSKAVGVIWLDSGSEIFASRWTRAKLVRMMNRASQQGSLTYALHTTEANYTKVDVIRHFGGELIGNRDIQFQANFFMLHGNLGKKIATEWFDNIRENPELLNDNSQENSPEFIEHRHDQSIFSMVCKLNNILPAISPPPSGRNGIKSILKSAFYPIWISRNRSGVSVKPKWLTDLGRISLMLDGSHSRAIH